MICWYASEGVSPGPESIVFRGAVPHGAEQKVEASKADSAGLRVAVRLERGEPFSALVPDGATLFLRDYGGAGLARICRQGSQVWEVAEVAEATQVFPSAGAAAPAAAEALPAAEAARRVAAEPAAEGSGAGGAEATVPQGARSPARPQPARAGPPPECVCPISHSLFADPVLAADGFTYERACLEEWWRRRGPRSPMTGRELASTGLVPNLAARALCEEYARRPGGPTREEGAGAGMEAERRGGGFYEPHLPALTEMFSHLEPEEVRAVCQGLAEEGVEDIDACVRRLLQRAGAGGEAAAVSLAPVCCAADASQAEAAAALLEPQSAIPVHWPAEREQLFVELLEHQIPPVRARKALELGGAESFEEAVEWLERHQDDADVDVPMEILQQRDAHQLAMDVMRVATVPVAHRLECFQALHKILGRILADPESRRLRQLRLSNEKFRRQVGRFPQAVALLKAVGFTKGDFWVSASQREPCLEFLLPLDSDNPSSQRFIRAYSLLEEVLRNPDEWLATVGEAQEETPGAWVAEEQPEAALRERTEAEAAASPEAKASPRPGLPRPAASGSAASRAFLAELHERRVRDPRGFQEAMRAAGKKANPAVVGTLDTSAEARTARRLEGAAGGPPAGAAGGYRRLSERFGGRREFNLQDLEEMRVADAIEGRTQYAKEYEAQRGQATSYAELLTRSYDPQYLGRKALDDSNNFRALQRMPPLRWSQAIADIAAAHARQMARGEMPFSHQGFDARVRQYPFVYVSAAENLAYNSGVADAAGLAVEGWIKSPGHRKNLLGAFDLCGVGVAQSSAGQFFFTQLFARTAGGALC